MTTAENLKALDVYPLHNVLVQPRWSGQRPRCVMEAAAACMHRLAQPLSQSSLNAEQKATCATCMKAEVTRHRPAVQGPTPVFICSKVPRRRPGLRRCSSWLGSPVAQRQAERLVLLPPHQLLRGRGRLRFLSCSTDLKHEMLMYPLKVQAAGITGGQDDMCKQMVSRHLVLASIPGVHSSTCKLTCCPPNTGTHPQLCGLHGSHICKPSQTACRQVSDLSVHHHAGGVTCISLCALDLGFQLCLYPVLVCLRVQAFSNTLLSRLCRATTSVQQRGMMPG